MSRVLVVGNALPTFYPDVHVEAAHYRTWQFVESLVHDGHEILLVGEANGSRDAVVAPTIPSTWNNLTYRALDFTRYGWRRRLQALHDRFRPDCIVGVNFYPSLYATRLHTSSPMWLEVYGDMLTILQAVCYRRQNNNGQLTTRRYLRQILTRGDVFSACGEPQQHAIVGEIAMAGRLNWQTFGYSFSRVIPPGSAPLQVDRPAPALRTNAAQLGIPPDAFVVLWAGGYNTWTDVDTLHRGLELAFEQGTNVHFVSLGASTYVADDNMYLRFQDMIARSPNRSRYHLLGWRPWKEIPAYCAESDVGINIDALHYETIYGTRTRLLEMIAAGLPVVTTLGSDLSYRLQAQGIAFGFDVGDWRTFGQLLIDLSDRRDSCLELSQRASRAAREAWSFSETTRPLRDWVRDPQRAPDRNRPDSFTTRMVLTAKAAVRQFLWSTLGADR
jgi:glycosyltransferase involved in cell wall biosynthesis